MKVIENLTQQIRRHAVALISLTVAVTSLGYNTWRNETTEQQRNLRHAAFQLVAELGEFQSRANQLAYGQDPTGEFWTGSWGNVLTIRTVGQLLPEAVQEQTTQLYLVWEANGNALKNSGEAHDLADQAIHEQIEATRQAILDALTELD